ncbi:MAG: hypothetical protein JSR44_10385 [Spirochaetes bacterium]|nr:hypothetical protein [Spirochaetota bacterium]
MKIILTTSISLPSAVAGFWRSDRQEIMRFAERFLRVQMRHAVRREVTRKYNRLGGSYEIITTRFTAAEYDTLHYVASALRVSVSSLIFGIIKLWLKPSRRSIQRFFLTNYQLVEGKWDSEGGIVEEIVTFWRVNAPDVPPPWNEIASLSRN